MIDGYRSRCSFEKTDHQNRDFNPTCLASGKQSTDRASIESGTGVFGRAADGSVGSYIDGLFASSRKIGEVADAIKKHPNFPPTFMTPTRSSKSAEEGAPPSEV